MDFVWDFVKKMLWKGWFRDRFGCMVEEVGSGGLFI